MLILLTQTETCVCGTDLPGQRAVRDEWNGCSGEHWLLNGGESVDRFTHPVPNNLSKPSISFEVTLESDSLSDNNRRQGLYGNCQISWKRAWRRVGVQWKSKNTLPDMRYFVFFVFWKKAEKRGFVTTAIKRTSIDTIWQIIYMSILSSEEWPSPHSGFVWTHHNRFPSHIKLIPQNSSFIYLFYIKSVFSLFNSFLSEVVSPCRFMPCK